MKIEENTEVVITLGEEAQTGKIEENIAQIDMIEETIAQDIGKIDRIIDPETEGTTHLKKAEGTLVTTDEGDAKGPWVMEGPLQANPGPGHPSAKRYQIEDKIIYTASPPGEYQTGENLGEWEETAADFMTPLRGACSHQGEVK